MKHYLGYTLSGTLFICFSLLNQSILAQNNADCNAAFVPCGNSVINISANGFGTVDELTGNAVSNPTTNPASGNAGCLLAGEQNSTWVLINVISTGDLEFTYGNGINTGCFDWAMWPYNTSTCNDIMNNILPPVRCNWNGFCQGLTGMANVIPPGGDATDFEPSISAQCGDQFILCLTNYSAQIGTMQLDFTGTAQVDCAPCNPVCLNSTLTLAGTITDSLSCQSPCTGSATVTATGGAPPYTYSWDDPSGQTTPTATGLCPGLYSATVTDSLGCSVGISILIQNISPQPNYTVSDISCVGNCDGSINSNPSGGTLPYSFNWVDASTGTTISTTNTANNLCAGTYVLNVTDASGCGSIDTIVLINPSLPTASNNVTPATCNTCDGVSTFSITNGTPPYTYSWSPSPPFGQGTASASGLCAGVYQLTVTDGNGCTSVHASYVPNSGADSLIVNVNDISCYGNCDGSASASNAVITNSIFNWYDNAGNALLFNSPIISNLCAGTYVVESMEPSGCINYEMFTITAPNPLVLNTNVTNSCGNCVGEIDFVAFGGAGNYEYSIDNGVTFSASSTFTNLCPGTYSIIVRDQNGCIETDTVTIMSYPGLDLTLSTIDAFCFGQCDGSAAVTPVGGTAPFSFLWTPNTSTTNSAGNLCAGTYSVTIFDAAGCSADSIGFVINEPPAQVPDSIVTTTISCQDSCDASITVYASGATNYALNGNAPTTNNTFNNLCSGWHVVEVNYNTGCRSVDSVFINNPAPTTATVTSDTTICANACVQLQASGLDTYTWTPAVGLNDANIPNPMACPPDTLLYCVTGTVASGCPVTAECVWVNVLGPGSFGNAPDQTIPPNGSVVLCAQPVSLDYTYLWNTGATTACINVSPDSTTTYYVTLTDTCGNSYTDTIVVVIDSNVTVLENNMAIMDMHIFPNPGREHIFVEFSLNETSGVVAELLDISGKLIHTIATDYLVEGRHRLQYSIGDDNVESGIYYIRLRASGTFVSKGVVFVR